MSFTHDVLVRSRIERVDDQAVLGPLQELVAKLFVGGKDGSKRKDSLHAGNFVHLEVVVVDLIA